MLVGLNPKQFVDFFNDFVKTGKVMFNFKWTLEGLDVQVISDFSMTTLLDCELIDGPPMSKEPSYYINSSIHLFNDTDKIFMEFREEDMATITQGDVSYTLIEEYEGRRNLPEFDEGAKEKLAVGRLQYLISAARDMIPISKELKKLPSDVVIANGHFYNMYSNIAFVDEISLPDLCVPYGVLYNIVFKLKKKDAMFCVDGDQLILRSDKYTFYISLTNYNLAGNETNMIDELILTSKKVSVISFKSVKERVQLILGILKNQEFTFSVSRDNFYMTVSSADSAANVKIGDIINQPIATVSFTEAQVSVIMKLFGDDEEVEIYLCRQAIRFKVGTKNLFISVLAY